MQSDLQRYYESQFEMMATNGWKDLMEDMQTLSDQINTIKGVSETDLRFKQGQLDILELILGRKAMCEATFEELNEKNL